MKLFFTQGPQKEVYCAEGKERVYEPDSEEDVDYEGIFDCIEGKEVNG